MNHETGEFLTEQRKLRFFYYKNMIQASVQESKLARKFNSTVKQLSAYGTVLVYSLNWIRIQAKFIMTIILINIGKKWFFWLNLMMLKFLLRLQEMDFPAENDNLKTVLRIRDVFYPSRIPDLGSRIQKQQLKGTVSRDFLLQVFFMNQFPPSPRVSH